MPKVTLIHPGTQYSYQLAIQLHKKGVLVKFVTGFSVSAEARIIILIKKYFPEIHQKILNRIIECLPQSALTIFPSHEFFYLLKLKFFSKSENNFFNRNYHFQKKVNNSVYKQSDVVIGFDTSSWLVINHCKRVGLPFILDVSIGHSKSKNSVYKDISIRYPQWLNSLEIKSNKFLEVEQFELMNASHIVVASSFSKKTLVDNGILPQKISINPYGINLDRFQPKKYPKQNNKLNLIFTGLVDARKGVPFLIEVLESFSENIVSISFVGHIDKEVKLLIQTSAIAHRITIFGKQPHTEIPILLRSHDVFIFPSFFEGFAQVILEAMASGLPVITTTATAGPDIIENGKEGFIIEPGNSAQLKSAIQFFIDNPNHIEQMGIAARSKAEQFSWKAYGDRWEKIIEKVLTP